MPLIPEIAAHYDEGDELSRLQRGGGLLERLRTLEILHRFLPPPPATLLDIGGATGVYALPLAKDGFRVHLVDPMPFHVEQATLASRNQPDHALAGISLGDARCLEFTDAFADGVLLLGPLYHLTDPADRLKALREAQRCLRPGGVMIVAAISRFASLIDGLTSGLIDDPAFVPILRRDLRDGQHRNTSANPAYFTTAFCHHPDELAAEVRDAGFRDVTVLGVEGPAWRVPRMDAYMADPRRRELVLELARTVESDPAIVGASAHVLAVAHT